jgi:Uncharacterized protein conserved in bacteria
MLKPQQILDAALRKWPAALRAEAAGEVFFPMLIPFGRPRPTEDFAILRQEIGPLAAARHCWRVDWQEVETRKWGRQRWPVRIAFDSIENLAAALGRSSELTAFRDALRQTREACPALEPWLRTKAHHIVEHLDDWRALVAVCAYFANNPRPHCHARQIPVPLGTKFIEEHAGILRELLDVVVGNAANAAAVTFAERFNLLVEPPLVRFRFLDPSLPERVGWPVIDCSIPLPTFGALQWSISRVLIVENRDVFLCLPTVPDALAVFGSGKAVSLLVDCRWMKTAKIVYWGDCDEAGYGILSNLRASFPHVESLLMDEPAWRTWKHMAVPGKTDGAVNLSYLTASEQLALKAVLAGPWMLEQERIPVAEAERAISAIFHT